MRNFLLSILSAVLLSCGWLGFSGLPLLVAFVPLFFVERRFVGWSMLTLALWSGATTWWIAMVPGGWPGAVFSVAITTTLFGAVFWVFSLIRGRERWVFLVAAWVAAEWLYTIGELSFPWLTLGNGLANDVWAVQWYEWTGVFGGSVWILASNILIYKALRHWATWTVVAVPVVVSLLIYFTYNERGDERTLTVVQPNFFAWEKFGYVPQDAQIDTMLRLASLAPKDVDYIVYPETAVDAQMEESRISENPVVERFGGFLAKEYPDSKIVLGATTLRFYRQGERISHTARQTREGMFYDFYNSALALDSTRNVEIHHKTKLVVGVERMPFRGKIKALDRLMVDLGGTSNNLGTDSVANVFWGEVGAAICWEAVFGEYFAEFVRNGATLMTVISNDSWWGDTRGHKQLFAYSRLRAIETRRSIARSAATGTSGFIDQRGRVISKTGWNERAAPTATLHTSSRMTLYTRFGDYIARISVLLMILSVLYGVAMKFRRR